MRNFLIQAYLNYRALFYWLNWPGYISSVVMQPAMSVVVYVLLGRFMINSQAAQYFAMGAAVSSIAFVTIGGIGQTYTYDRQLFTMSFVFISPVNRFLNFLSRGLLHYPNALVAFLCSILTTYFLTGVSFSTVDWMGFISSALITAAALCGFAQFLSIFIIITRDWMNTLSVSLGLLVVLTGVVIPVSYFPAPVQEIVRFLPMTNGLQSLRLSFSGTPFTETYSLIIREAITGLIYLLTGGIGFIAFERVAKKSGVMETEVIV
jgi:ABC-2 type transport system permease protein